MLTLSLATLLLVFRQRTAQCIVRAIGIVIHALQHVQDLLAPHTAADARLNAMYSAPSERVLGKVLQGRLDAHARHFVSLSPFLVIASSGARYGRRVRALDCSPKGGVPGFVHVCEDGRVLAIPDVVGNNRLDTLRNLATGDNAVGLIFLVPGLCELLRVNGTAVACEDHELLSALSTTMPDGSVRTPKLAIKVLVHQAYLHCGKAITRSRFWEEGARRARADFPSLASCVVDQLELNGINGKLQPGPAVVDGRLDRALYETLCDDALKPAALY